MLVHYQKGYPLGIYVNYISWSVQYSLELFCIVTETLPL
jgi:hypothetical protein